jgi:hypothetical protein
MSSHPSLPDHDTTRSNRAKISTKGFDRTKAGFGVEHLCHYSGIHIHIPPRRRRATIIDDTSHHHTAHNSCFRRIALKRETIRKTAATKAIMNVIDMDVSLIETRLFINGKFVNSVSGKTFDTVDPATEQVICAVQEADAADVDIAVRTSIL